MDKENHNESIHISIVESRIVSEEKDLSAQLYISFRPGYPSGFRNVECSILIANYTGKEVYLRSGESSRFFRFLARDGAELTTVPGPGPDCHRVPEGRTWLNSTMPFFRITPGLLLENSSLKIVGVLRVYRDAEFNEVIASISTETLLIETGD